MPKSSDIPCDPPLPIRVEITGAGLNRMMELRAQSLLKHHSEDLLHYRVRNNTKSLTFHFICNILKNFLSSYFLVLLLFKLGRQSKTCVYKYSLSFLFAHYNSLLFFPTQHSFQALCIALLTLHYVKHQLVLRVLA